MKRACCFVLLCIFGLMLTVGLTLAPVQISLAADEPVAPAAEVTPENPAHHELRQLRDDLVAAVNKGDLDAVASYCHPNVCLTTPDAVVSRGVAAVKEYYESKMSGPTKVVESFSSKPAVDDLATIYFDNVAVATGTSIDHFKLTSGMEFDLNARWSATLVKEDGKWLIASYHTATSLFDNPLLNSAKQGLIWTGGICLFVGLLLGVLFAKLRNRRQTV